MFKHLPEDQALIVQNGVYTPVDVYEGPEGGLYVKKGSGFVRLRENGSTSAPAIAVERLHRDQALYRDQFGRLCVTKGTGRSPVSLVATDEKPFQITKQGS